MLLCAVAAAPTCPTTTDKRFISRIRAMVASISIPAHSLRGPWRSGNSNRRFFHGPGIDNWDFALHKGTQITEKAALEFRAEFFNVFNHAQFTSPYR